MGANQSKHPVLQRRSSKAILAPKDVPASARTRGCHISTFLKFLKTVPKKMTTEVFVKTFLLGDAMIRDRNTAYVDIISGDNITEGKDSSAYFIPVIDQATCFVTHSWLGLFHDLVNILLQYEKLHPRTYFWIDIFSTNQMQLSHFPAEWLSDRFKFDMINIGSLLLVATPWDKPIFLERAWCLYELYICLSNDLNLDIMVPTTQLNSFFKAIKNDGNSLLQPLRYLNAVNMTATYEQDLTQIRIVIENSLGQSETFDNNKVVGIEALTVMLKKELIPRYIKAGSNLGHWQMSSNMANEMTATIFYQCADAFAKLRLFDEAILHNQLALTILNQLDLHDHEAVISIQVNFGLIFREQNLFEDSLLALDKALLMAEKHKPKKDLRAGIYNNFGYTYNAMGDFVKAKESMQKALVIRQQTLGYKHHYTAQSYNNVGIALMDLSEPKEALVHYEKCLAIQLQAFEADDAQIAITLINMGQAYAHLEMFARSTEFLQKGIQIQLQKGTLTMENNAQLADVAKAYLHLANTAAGAGQVEQSGLLSNQGIAIQKKIAVAGGDLEVARTYCYLGSALNHKGDFQGAIDLYQKAVGIQRGILGDSHATLAQTYTYIAATYADGLNDHGTARKYYKMAVIIAKACLEPGHADIQRYQVGYIYIYIQINVFNLLLFNFSQYFQDNLTACQTTLVSVE